MTQILVVDDVPAMAGQYAYDLKRVGGYETIVAAGGDEAFDILGREPIDCVVLDLEMPGTDGFELLRRLKQHGIETPVIVYTGAGSYDRCIQAVRLGAHGFIDKAEPIERVVHEIENALARGRMVRELRSLRSRVDDTSLIGDSAPMRQLRAAIARVAPIPSGVLIVGESGSGKELVAKELHRLGPGAKTPLVSVNSAALPEQLVESELFGHERGAFTGADRLRRGAFESRRERDPVPRRDWRAAAPGAGQAAARARGPSGDAARRQPCDSARGACGGGDESRPRAGGRRRSASGRTSTIA